MPLDPEIWEEVEPCVYQLRAYTPEQIERMNQRPTELINKALRNARRVSTLPPSHCGGDK